MAGYSGKPLAQKLGIKEGMRFHLSGAPHGYAAVLGLPRSMKPSPLAGELDFIQAFFTDAGILAKDFPKLKARLTKSGMLWISWAKKSSPLFSGVTEDLVRRTALENGLVDVKVCAVTDDWSGLKLVYRKANR